MWYSHFRLQFGGKRKEKPLAVSHKVKYSLSIQTSNPTPRYLPKNGGKICFHNLQPYFIVTLFIISKTVNNPKSFRLWYIHIRDQYVANKSKQTTNTCNNIDSHQTHYRNQKTGSKGYSVSFHFYSIQDKARQTVWKENRLVLASGGRQKERMTAKSHEGIFQEDKAIYILNTVMATGLMLQSKATELYTAKDEFYCL